MRREGPPVARRDEHVTEIHGVRLVDPYRWLRRRDDPEVLAYLEAENRWTERQTAHLEPLRRTLFEEIRGRIRETDTSAPWRLGDWIYYRRTEKGLDYAILCRRRGSMDAPEEIVVDPNALAEGRDYLSLGAIAVSPEQERVALTIDDDGSERHELAVRDIGSGELTPLGIDGAADQVVWAEDGRTLFYVMLDEAHRPWRVMRHLLGTPPSQDVTVYEEPDERFHVRISKTRSRRFIRIEMESSITSEVRLVDARAPAGEPVVVWPREQGVEYDVDHRGDHLYVLTNRDAREFRVLRGPLPGESGSWDEIVPHDPSRLIERLDLFAGHMVLTVRRDGLRRLVVRELAGGAEHEIAEDEPVWALRWAENPEFDTTTLRFETSSLRTPWSTWEYDMDTRERRLVKREEIGGGYDPERYETARAWATAPDGARVPISLVYRRGTPRDGSNPCWLYGYGAYGITIDPGFRPERVSLLERGVVFAIAHVRGGAALGRAWYESGKFLDKPNTFRDFIAAAETLIEDGWTSPERLAISGGSAGGMLIGAVLNMRPELFRVAVAHVPFVDVINTMLDEDLPLTVIEYEEWGDPHDEKFFRAMLSYSPYDNVGPKPYPALLVTAGLHDPRVQYWEPAKWVARIRAEGRPRGPVLLKTNMGAGHAGASGRYKRFEEIAFEYAFVLDQLGLAS
ncbi:MAG: S9 family peptidase [Acidobacteria bacterium]|nr:MAG: S9 family peptidase [Acidobacteriota bacterium]